MAQAGEQINDILTCGICMELYNDTDRVAKLLPCHHSFCSACIQHIINEKSQLTCPTCRKSLFNVRPRSVDELQSNFYVGQMIDLLHETGLSTPKGCRKHRHKALTHFCKSCGISICDDCLTVDHRDGNWHSTQTHEEALTEQHGLLSMDLLEAQGKIANNKLTIQQLQSELGNLNASKDFSQLEIEKTFTCYIEALKLRKEKLMNELRKLYLDKRNALIDMMDDLRRNTQILSGLVDQSDHLLHTSLLVDVLAYREKLSSKINQNHGTENLEENNFIRFCAQSEQDQLLGSIQNLGNLTADQVLPSIVSYKNLTSATACLFTTFTVQVSSYYGDYISHYPIDVTVIDPYDNCVPCRVMPQSDGRYDVTVRPKISGQHQVKVSFLGHYMQQYQHSLQVESNDPVMIIGQSGDGPDEMDFPRAVATDSINNIYVVDTGNFRIQKYNSAGKMVQSFPIGLRHCRISSCGIAIDSVRETLMVPEVIVHEADLGEATGVLMYNLDGQLLTQFSHTDLLCKGLSLAVNSQGHIVIVDNELNAVVIFDRRGKLLKSFGSDGTAPGEFDEPTFVCVSNNDDIIVSDSLNNRIQIFDKDGIFVQMLNGEKFGRFRGGFSLPFGVAVDCHGNILVVDGKLKQIQVFKVKGDYVGSIESLGNPMNAPRGIAVTDDGHVLVADRDNHCIKKYQYLQCTQL